MIIELLIIKSTYLIVSAETDMDTMSSPGTCLLSHMSECASIHSGLVGAKARLTHPRWDLLWPFPNSFPSPSFTYSMVRPTVFYNLMVACELR
jgi:hypothetical protein